jgi:hypothetical protein
VNKKNNAVRTIIQHQYTGSYFRGEWYTAMATCGCGWERECSDRGEADKLHAKHLYRKIKKTLSKHKKLRSL